jgi:hypothetical protein
MEVIKNLVKPTTFVRWNVQNLDYNWYLALSIAGGYFGLDYLYLGSPIGAFAKMMFNISTFGYWWFYDALNAVVGQDEIRLYGPTAPVLGAIGIGAARFRDAKNPSSDPALKKHLNFLIYGLVLGFLGMFGGDSFLTGNFVNGLIRLISMISFIGIPIAIIWWVRNLYYYVFDTNTCINQNFAYFGAPAGGGSPCPSFFASFLIFLLQTVAGIVGIVPGVGPLIQLILNKLIKSLMEAYGMLAEDAVKAEIAFDRLAAHAGASPMDVKELQKAKIGLEAKPHDKDCKANLTPLTEQEEAAARAAAAAKAAAPPAASASQAGGGVLLENSSYLPLFLSITIGLVVVSSIVVSLRRLRQNAKSTTGQAAGQHGSEETDEPPHPGHTRGPTPV